jgi:hypothetical protein
MREKALLIGNDINNVTETYSWNDLITGLLSYFQIDGTVNLKDKPFPLLYEEIYLNSALRYQTPERRLKAYIASQTRNLNPNELHKSIIELGIENILTTNYDLSFERAIGLKEKDCTNKGFIKESLYSMFRCHKAGNNSIWHIHGSETSPKSITLGYEHYSGYLQQMRNYTATGTKGVYRKTDFQSLSKRIREGQINHESWVDFFFTHDIYIFGLNLDFVEMHLWWLLTYRSRAKVEKKIDINNNIFYFYPKIYEKSSKNKLEMFRVNGVTTISEKLYSTDKMAYYNNIIEKIKNVK